MSLFRPIYVFAALLPFLSFSWLLPNGVVELDRWLLWVLAMLVVGLPMLFLELALAKRSQQSVWTGIQILTREADAQLHWRLIAVLSVLLFLLFGAALLSSLSSTLSSSNDLPYQPHPMAASFVLTICALLIAPFKQKTLPIALVCMMVAAVFGFDGTAPILTAVSVKEWGIAVIMALFSTGLGTGAYWFLQTSDAPAHPSLAQAAFRIWLIQLAFGLLAFGLFNVHNKAALPFVALGVLCASAFLFYYAHSQLIARFGLFVGVGMGVASVLIFALLPSAFLHKLVVVVALLTALCLSLFTGFVMKSSHLRKALGFASEGRYLLWRVFVRIVLPIMIVSSLVGWLL